jgi:hypothetical protein
VLFNRVGLSGGNLPLRLRRAIGAPDFLAFLFFFGSSFVLSVLDFSFFFFSVLIENSELFFYFEQFPHLNSFKFERISNLILFF